MLPNKVVGDDYKEAYKRGHHSKFLSNDPEIKNRFNKFEVKPIFRPDDRKHFNNLYAFDDDLLNQFRLPEEKKELNLKQKKSVDIKVQKNNLAQSQKTLSQSKTTAKPLNNSQNEINLNNNNIHNSQKTVLNNSENVTDKGKKNAISEKENTEIIGERNESLLDQVNLHSEVNEELQKNPNLVSEEDTLKNLKEILKKVFDPSNKREEGKKTEEELYIKKGTKTAKTIEEIDNGEKAVQFFAMYGNTTPIKFIFCKKKSVGNTFDFRPYDLEVIESESGDDYFIITPTGITHVYKTDSQDEYAEKASKEKNLDKVAEFYTLSDWMYQSTLFNIIKRINYFKNYVPFKLLTIWRNYTRFKKFLLTRKNLSNKLFVAKPAFVSSLIKSNGQIFQLLKVPLHDITHQTWSTKNLMDFDEFHKPMLETAKSTIKKMIDNDIFDTLKNLYSSISFRLKENREIDETENSKTLQEVKNKSMFKLKIEKQMRKKLIAMAKVDVDLFDRFVQLIDLMCVEMLFQLNKKNMKNIRNEINKPRPETNNTGIFTLTVSFPGGEVIMNPNDKDIEDHFKVLFKLMIDAIVEAPRFISIFQKKDYENIFNLDGYSESSGANNNNTLPATNNVSENDRTFTKTYDGFDENLKINFKIMIEAAKYYKIFTNEINEKIRTSFKMSSEKVRERIDQYAPLQKDSENWVAEEYIKERPKVESIRQKIEDLRKWSLRTDDLLSTFTAAHIMNIDVNNVKDSFKAFILSARDHLDKYVKEKYDSVIKKISEDVKLFEKIKPTKKNNITAACEYKQSLNKYQASLKKLQIRVDKLTIIYMLIKSYKIEIVSQTSLSDYDLNKNAFIETETKCRNGYEEINKLKDYYTNILEGEVKGNKEKIKELYEEITTGIYLDVDTSRDLIRDSLSNMSQAIANCEQKSKENNRHLNILENNPPDQGYKDKELDNLKNAFDLRSRLWSNLMNLDEDTIEWKKLTINQMRKTKIEDKIREYKTIGLDLSQKLSEVVADKVCELFLEKTRIMDISAPIIIALSSPSMQDTHWREIFGYLKVQYVPDRSLDELSLGDLIDKYNITSYAEQLDVISASAIAQEKIQKDLQKLQNDWSNTRFNVIPHNKSKDKFIISALDDILTQYDEHSQLVQSALNSRHVAVIRDQVQKWDDDLNTINRVIEEWLMVQKQWIYLENIFSADDIKRQLPDAHKNFTKVNKGFKDLMHKTNTNPNVLDRCCEEGLLDMLVRFTKELDNIQKSLEDYLQTKRKAFPRFYFLSNDELLKILSQTRNPRAVQDYLNKCFDGIKTINFLSNVSNEIIDMVSPENEVVKLSKSLLAHENIESWLSELETIMYTSVYDFCKTSLEDHPEFGKSRKDWIYHGHACQGIITVDQIMWGNLVEEQFEKHGKGNHDAIRQYSKYLEGQIFELAEMVRDKVEELKKSLVERLIIINVHARDVVRDLIRENVTEKNNFEWQKNLKFYWEFDHENRKNEVVIKQTNSRFIYGYEYLGNPERMVITPLTDKCYITLTSALHLMYGGAPAGPAGTGKTETTKDLSKALAVKVNVFNCSDQLDFKTMGRMFCGLAECGAWACFDEFNRIDLEVLSVIAQQIETIQSALKEKKKEMIFEGNLIGLKNGFGVFITMNPGYAGRSELPDNLKSLFRPVAMMIPDYALVSEVTLFSKGFKEAKELSVKMYQLFKLCSEQLSKQKHYDFGLRGIKSILSRAGYLKEKFAHEPEKIVLIRAMKDSNLPKFLDNDIELFLDIISDLFPRVEVEKVENKLFLDKVKDVLAKDSMVPIPRFIEKINQLLDTMMVRLGNMIVGLAGTGKSSLYHTLAKTLSELGKQKDIPADNWFCPITTNILNPKSVTKNDLYMSKDEITQTWEDGIVAKLMRMAEEEEKEEKTLKRRWVVFDGPVDALWIEDMNTVLDDSRKLCLPDSSNIRIPKMMNLIFEVQDLLVASPATVSRCGMVYLEVYHVGYMPIIETWSATYKAKLSKIFEDDGSRKQKALSDTVDRYLKQFEKTCESIKTYVPKMINFIRANCKEKVPTVDVNLVTSLLHLTNCFFNPEIIKLSTENLEDQFNYYLSFCLIWSLGGNIEDDSRKNFMTIMKEVMTKLGIQFDFSHDVYDLYVNDKCTFSKWNERKENFKYDKELSFFNILVPTQDTIKYKYLMDNLSKQNYNSLFIGETGVGKSVIVMDYLNKLDASQFLFKSSNFSAKTTSKNVYDTLKASIFKNGNFQPPSGKKFIYFIDDINLPQLDQYGSQQPVEFIRQLIDLKTFYDDKKMQKKIKDVIFMSACAPPSGGRNKVTQRLFRHFNIIWMTELSVDSMKQIFKSIIDGFLELGPNKSLLDESEDIIDAALDLYNKIRTEKLPTPSKSHYTFNLRDLSKVIQGMLQVNPDYFTDRTVLINCWIHETSRQFRDRLLGDDIEWFDKEISNLHDVKFRLGKPSYSIDQLIFSNVVDKSYKHIIDFQLLTKRVNEALEKYNISQRSGTMNLVFFNDAILHFCRIARILWQDRGNGLLVGLGGSGRQSLTKLVGSNMGFQINQLQIGKGYGVELFWKDIGKILMKAGTSENTQIFIFSDTQIIVESFLEDINNILNNGEVPNLFKEDELAVIFNTLKDAFKSENSNVPETKDAVYQYFVSNVRKRLRIVLCFSPVGEGFRNRCRQFPSIINCCTIDWFNPWPEEALISVADRFLNTLNSPPKEIKDTKEPVVNTSISDETARKLQNIFVKIQSKALQLSTKFYEELRRSYYITPTSYLEFIKLFLDIYNEKIQIIPKQILNYKLGIEKLEEANIIVKNLKNELIELEPMQIAKKKEVEALIVDLDKSTKIVEMEKTKIQGDKDAVEIKRNEILKVKEECDADLSKAKPELENAKVALSKLNEDDFRIL